MTDTKQPDGPRRPSDEELLSAAPGGERGREARLGLFVTLGLVSVITVLYMMTDPAMFRGRYMLVTLVENAGGVRTSDPIQMQGVNLGRVNGFEMVGPSQVYITMEIEGRWVVPQGSTVKLGEAGLFGGRTVEIIQGPGNVPLEAWDTLPGVGASGGLLGSFEEVSGQASTVLTRIEALLTEDAVGDMQGSARELEGLLAEMSGVVGEQRGALKGLTESLQRSADGIEGAAAAGPDIASAIARADSVMASLTETSASLDGTVSTLRSILDRVDRGEGTLGRLVHDDALYTSLNDAAEGFAALVQDLKENPGKYINLSIF